MTRRIIPLLICACLALAGCGVTGEVENQAYVLVLGMDRLEGGQLELTARVPRIGKDEGDGMKEGSGGSPYLVFSASGGTYAQALEALQWATPRPLNLSHAGMVVASSGLAREAGFGRLVEAVVETPHLYGTARFVVCDGTARAFIEEEETIIGTRLTSELRAMLKHYVDQGFVPDSTLADACYAGSSIYGDPLAIWAYVDDAAGQPAALMTGETGGTATQSPSKLRFAGAALFQEGTLADVLDASQTRLLNLIRGSAAGFPFEYDGTLCELTRTGAAKKNVLIENDNVTLTLNVRLNTQSELTDAEAARLETAMREDIEALIGRCQALRVDPFGFAEAAARRFLTVQEWLAWGWRERYAGADVEVSISVERA